MSKELTEQWRNGALPESWYYIHLKSNWGNIDCITINYCDEDCVFEEYPDEDIREVLAPVPTYNQFVDVSKKVDELKQQLAEANKILFNVWDCREDREYYAELAESYFEKYGVEK